VDILHGLDLFTGIGGLTLALSEWVNPVAYCENDRYAQSVLLSRMAESKLPRAPIWDDVRTLTRKQFDLPVDIIYGGFPCQNISVAGKGDGIHGDRSGLFFEIIRLVDEIKPSLVFLENVPAIRVRGLREVLREFTERGFNCRWTMLSAKEVGACHKRERWFLLAYSESDRARRHSRGTKTPSTVNGSSLQKPMSYGAWSSQPTIYRGNNGLSYRSHRIKCLGNSVVPIQAKEAFKRLIDF